MSIDLINKLKADRLAATKASDHQLKTLLGTVIGEIDRNKGNKQIDDSVAVSSIKKMISAINENIAIGLKHGYPVDSYDYELRIMKSYVPDVVVLSEEETRKLIGDLISSGAANIGAIMKGIGSNPVDKALASRLAKEMLISP